MSDDDAVANATNPWVIGGNTRIYPILGDPIAQVHCPELLNPYFRKLGIDAVMIPLHVPAGTLAECFRAIRTMQNVGGVVVTIPHKAVMASLIERLVGRGKRLAAVNIARREPDGSWSGDHLDGVGFVASLRQRGWAVENKHVFLSGCGGAGSAIADALAEASVASVCLYDADPFRVGSLTSILERCYPGLLISQGLRESQHFDLVINATSLGMREEDPLPIPQSMLRPGRMVADIIMTPARTRLLETAERLGCEVHYGKPMLTAQIEMMVAFFRREMCLVAP